MYSFRSVIYKEGILYVAEIPEELAKKLGKAKHTPVRGFVDGITFKSTVVPRRDNRHVINLNGDIRKKISKGEGDPVELSLEYDPDDREIPLPEDVELILSEDETLLQEFLNSSPSNRREYLKYIMRAKHEETRLRRIQLLVQRMQESISKRG